jgi:hypothetical protein
MGLRGWLTEFVRYRREYLRGDEKGKAQIFSERLFVAFGHAGVRQAGATLEQDLMWKPRCLIEMKKTGVELGRVYRQAFDYWVHAVPTGPLRRVVLLCTTQADRPEWVILSSGAARQSRNVLLGEVGGYVETLWAAADRSNGIVNGAHGEDCPRATPRSP